MMHRFLRRRPANPPVVRRSTGTTGLFARLRFEELEPRILMSADLAPGLGADDFDAAAALTICEPLPAHVDAIAQDYGASWNEAAIAELYVVQPGVAGELDRVEALAQSQVDGSALVVELDATRDGFAQLAELTDQLTGLERVTVVAPLVDGQFTFGDGAWPADAFADRIAALPAAAGIEFDLRLATAAAETTAAPLSQRVEFVFIDSRVGDPQALVSDLLLQSDEHLRYEIVVVDTQSDGLAQIGAALQGRHDIAAVHVISHGTDGGILLGAGLVDAAALRAGAAGIESWSAALGAESDILLYGCDVAASADGRAFATLLAELTGADVASSDDATSAALLGGDWDLEYRVGDIGTGVALSAALQESWDVRLNIAPLGGEVLVNGTAAGQQTSGGTGAGSVAMDLAGNYVVVYTDTDSNSGDVFYRRFDSTGTAIGSAVRVNSTTTDAQGNARVAMASNGTFVVTWTSNLQDGSGTGIYARRFAADGTALAGEFRVNTTLTGNQSEPTIAMSASGAFVIGWISSDGSGTGIRGQRYDAAGVAQGGELAVNVATSLAQSAPIALMADTGTFGFVWQGLQSGSSDIYLRGYSATGTPGSEIQINQTTVGAQQAVSASTDEAGNVVVVWSSAGQDPDGSEGIYARRYNSAGVPQGNEFRVNTTTAAAQTAPVVSMDSDGEFVVAWTSDSQDGSGLGVYLQRFDANGIRIGSETLATTTTSGSQAVTGVAYVGTRLAVAWDGEGTGDAQGVFARAFSVADYTTYTVTTTGDTVSAVDGQTSLREAIIAANANSGASRIIFNIPSALVGGVHTITLTSALPDITRQVLIDATTEPDYTGRPMVALSGGGTVADLLHLYPGSDGSVVRGLLLQNYVDAGINIAGSNGNVIAGNWIGLSAAGTAGAAGGWGVTLWNANDNLIGGSTAADRNVIAGNSWTGVAINTDNGTSTGNRVQGNYIGTNATGTAAIGNNYQGVWVNAAGNTIGGTEAGQGNVISGSYGGAGVELTVNAPGTLVAGNYIGLNAAGTQALPNSGSGLIVLSANNVIGGTTAAARNVISGNGVFNIQVHGTGATGNVIIGNYIGTNAAGTADVNGTAAVIGQSGIGFGAGAANNRVGTNADGIDDALERNVISGNNWFGVEYNGVGTSGNVVQGNYIGTDHTGLVALGNTQGGVSFWDGASGNRLGSGVAAARNVVSGNGTGVQIADRATGNVVQGNYIGLGADGTTAVGNTGVGVLLYAGNGGASVTGNLVGTDGNGSLDATEGNVISANYRGVVLTDALVTGNTVAGNDIGSDASGLLDRGNLLEGVYLTAGAGGNLIGGPLAVQANRIRFNGAAGIGADGASTSNAFLRNTIAGNDGLGIDLGTAGVTANDAGDADTGANGLQNFPVIVYASVSGAQLTLSGTLSSTASTTYRIEFFRIPAGSTDGSGYGEAGQFLTAVDVTTDSSGRADIATVLGAAGVVAGDRITATATVRTGASSWGSTSELALNVQAFAASAPTGALALPGLALADVLGAYSFDIAADPGRDDAGGDAPITFVGNPSLTTGPGGDGAIDLSGGQHGDFGDITTGGPMSFAGWVRFDTTAAWQRVFDFGQDGAGGIGNIYVGRLDVTNDLTFTIEGNFGAGLVSYRANAVNAIANGTWLHVAATVDAGGAMRLYVNGTLAASAAGVVLAEGVRDLNYLAKSAFTPYDAPFDGAIDDFVIVRSALSAQQVAGLYQQGAGFAVNENAANGTLVGTVLPIDPDNDGPHVFTLVDSAGGRFAVDASGQITVANGALLDFESAASHAVTVRITDQAGGFLDTVFNIALRNVNDAPVLGFASGDSVFPENAGAVVLAPNATVTDQDSVNFDGGVFSVSITANGQAEDRLGIRNQGTSAGQIGVLGATVSFGGVVIGTFTGGGDGTTPLVISLNANATVAAVQALARNITYQNVSEQPSALVRSLAAFVTDGDGGTSNIASATFSVSSVNDAPSFAAGPGHTRLVLAGMQFGNAIAQQPDGRYVVAGWSDAAGTRDFIVARFNADGSVDTSFGGGTGYVVTAVGAAGDEAQDVRVMADGRIVVVGYSTISSSLDISLARYLADGSLDTSFGGGTGKVLTGLASRDAGHQVVVQADGRILVAGESSGDFLLARFTAAGALDATFGTGGVVTTVFAGSSDLARAMEIQPDGRILLAGQASSGTSLDLAVVRYNANGTLDTTFNGTGTVLVDVGTGSNDQGYDLALQADGRILVTGFTNAAGTTDLVLVRLTTSGALDTSFNGTGRVITAIGSGSDFGLEVQVQTDGRIVVAGYASMSSNDFSIVRYNSNGTLDSTFGTGGRVTTDFGSFADDRAESFLIQADGRLVVVGASSLAGTYDLAIARYNTDGTLDTRFNAVTTLGGTVAHTEGGAAVVLDADAQVFDVELTSAGNFGGSTLTLARSGGASPDDVFGVTGSLSLAGGSVTVGGVVIGSVTTNSGGVLSLTFASGATNAQVNSTLRQLTYRTLSDTPPASVVVQWTFADGNAGAQGSGGALQATGTTTVTITATNDAPVIAGLDGDIRAYTEGGGAILVGSTTGVTDVDSANFDGGTLTVSFTGGSDPAEDVLAIQNQGTGPGQIGVSGASVTYGGVTLGSWAGGSSGQNLVITLNGSADATATAALINSITYLNTDADQPTTTTRNIRFVLTDGDGGTSLNNDTFLSVTAVNDAPLNNVPGALQTTATNTPLQFSSAHGNALTVSDVDASTLQVTLSATHGTLTLGSTTGLAFSSGDGSADATMTFSGTVAAINAALNGLSFAPTGGYQGSAALTLTTSDLGASGSGGILTDTDTVAIQIGAAVFQQGVNGYTGTEDTYVATGSSTTDHGAATTVVADDNSATDAALLRFGSLFGSGPGQIPTGSTITSVTLSIYVTNRDLADSVALHRMLGSWTEASTYNSLVSGVSANGIEAASTPMLILDAGVAGWNNLSSAGLTAAVQAWANGETNNGFAFISNAADAWAFASSENATVSLRPYLTVNFTPPQAPVVIASGGGAVYTENGSAVAVDAGVTLSDADSAALAGATIQITGNYASGQDVLAFVNQNGITGNWNSGTGTLTLSGTTTVANYQAALRSITFANTSEAPSTAGRTVSITVSDGNVASTTATRSISVTAVNDAPVFSGLGGSVAWTEGADFVPLAPAVTLVDAELAAAGNYAGATLSVLRQGGAQAADQLVFDGAVVTTSGANVFVSGVQVGTYVFTGGRMDISFGAGATQARLNALLQNIRYAHAGDTPPASVTMAWTFSDGNAGAQGSGGALQAAGTTTVVITAVADAPVVTTSGGTLSYTENDGARVLDAGVTITDVDSTTLSGATIRITGGYVSAQDVLGFVTQSGITGTWDVNSGTLSLTGTATVAQYQAALRAVTYSNTSEAPDVTARELTLTVTDGVATSSPAIRQITITAVNDAPTTTPIVLAPIAEDSGARLITQAQLLANAADPDGGALVATSLQLASGAGTLVDNGNGTWSYTPASNDSTGASFSYTISDGAGGSVAGSASLDITPVNDAPTTTPVVLAPIAEDSGPRVITQAELLANAIDVDGNPLTATNLQLASGAGSLVDNGDGTWTYTPAADDSTGASFSYTISDGAGGSVAGSASLDITPVNDAPSTTPVVLAPIAEDSGPRVITQAELLGNAVDVDGNPLTATNLQLASGAGWLVDNGDGTWTYTPAADDSTGASFSYTISDGAGGSVAGSASLDITPVNDAPTTTPVVLAPIAEDSGPRVITQAELLGNAVDVDVNPLTATNLQLASGAGSLVDNGDGTWTYTPAADDSTGASFSYTISDGAGGSVAGSASLDITPVNDAPTTTAVVLAPIAEDSGARVITQAELLANATDVDGNPLTATNLQLASGAGWLVDNGDGTWTYSPAANDSTGVSFSYTISDGAGGSVAGSATLDITPVNDAPTTTPVVLAPIAEDSGPRVITQAELLANATDVDGNPITAANLQLASGAGWLVDNGDGTWTYSPAANDSTGVSFSYTISDGAGGSVAGSASLDITPVNDAPTTTPVVLTPIAEDSGPRVITQAELLGNAVDVDGNPLTATNLQLASGAGSLVDNGNGTWTYTPAANDSTGANFSYTISDGAGGSVAGSASLDITPVNDAPTTTPVVLAPIAEDSGPRLITQAELLTNATDIDGNPLTATNLQLASGAGSLVDNGNGTWTYTPAADDATGASFSYTINDGAGGSVAGSASLDITPVNDAPTTTPVVLTPIAEDSGPRVITQAELLGNAVDVDGNPLTATNLQLASGAGSLVDNGDGTWTYTPAADDSTGVSFSYTVSDGAGGSVAGSASIDITPVNDAPTTTPVVLTPIAEDSGPRVITQAELLGNAVDVDGNPLTATNLQLASGAGSLVDNGNGTWTYTPAADDATGASFSYTINDGAGGSVAGSASLDITPVNDAPTTTPVVLTPIAEDSGPRVITQAELLGNAVDVDGNPLTATNLQLASGAGSLVDNGDGTWTYTPAADDSTGAGFSYSISDGAGGSVAGSASLDITPVNDSPTTTPVVLTPIAEDSGSRLITQAELIANATDIDGDPLTATNLQLASGSGSLVDNGDGTWTYTPAADDSTGASFSYAVSDGVGGTVAGSASLDITPVNDAPTTTPVVLAPIAEDSSPRLITQAELLTNATDVDGNPLTATNLQLASGSGSLVDNGDGTWTYTPAADDSTGASFSYLVSDGAGGSVAGSASLDITPVNDAPTTTPVVLAPIAEDSGPRLITQAELLSNATDVDGNPLTATNLQLASGAGSLVDNGDATWTYTPVANDSTGVSFSYTVSDGAGGSVAGSASLGITPVNDEPTTTPVVLAPIAEDSGARVITQGELLGNAADVDGNPLTATNLQLASGAGSLVDNGNGTWTYTPAANDSTGASFSYTISDDAGGSVPGSAALDITPVNDAPVFVSGGGAAAVTMVQPENVADVLTLVASDVDADALRFSIAGGADAAGFAVDAVTGQLRFLGAPDFERPADADGDGVYEVIVEAADGEGGVATQALRIVVANGNELPTPAADAFDAVGGLPTIVIGTTLLANDTDIDGDTLRVVEVSAPTSGTVTLGADGNWIYTPSGGFSGTDRFTYTVEDAGGLRATAEIRVEVLPVELLAPVGIDPLAGGGSGAPGAAAPPPAPQLPPPVATPSSPVPSLAPVPALAPVASPVPASSPGEAAPGQPPRAAVDGQTADALAVEVIYGVPGDESPSLRAVRGGPPTLTTLQRDLLIATRDSLLDLRPGSMSLLSLPRDNVEVTLGAATAQAIGLFRSVLSLSTPDDLGRSLAVFSDVMADLEDGTEQADRTVAEVVVGSGIAFSAGAVAWLLRAGALGASLFAAMPAWSSFDPIPIIRRRRPGRDDATTPQPIDDAAEAALARVLRPGARHLRSPGESA
jgi:uncharacterized delta-60 repeat protein/CSLREA domain-containing protein